MPPSFITLMVWYLFINNIVLELPALEKLYDFKRVCWTGSNAWLDVTNDLKLAFVTGMGVKPPYTKTLPENFRPVSLTSHVIKPVEQVVRKDLVNFLEKGNKMDPNQHGSRSGRSPYRSCLNNKTKY